MNLLFDFINIALDPEIKCISAIPVKGKEKDVLLELLANRGNRDITKVETLDKLNLTSSHFDKICSVLLDKCYEAIEPNGGFALIENLGRRLPSIEKHFYKEVYKQLAENQNDYEFLQELLELFQNNLPIKSKDHSVVEQIMGLLVKTTTSENEALNLDIRLAAKKLHFEIEKDFAAQKIRFNKEEYPKKLEILEQRFDEGNKHTQSEILRTKNYMYLALLEPEKSIPAALEAIDIFKKNDFFHSNVNLMRMQLRLAEAYYFTSQYRQALEMMREIYSSGMYIPDKGYNNTKYIQLCLIEGEIEEAKNMLNMQLGAYAKGEYYALRDVITTIKVNLFSGDYDNAHKLIVQGYEALVKAKYVQYEVELRNLEVAYFFLTGERDFVQQLCKRNIKFLRQNDFTIKTSRYPEFFMLIQAIIKSPNFTARQQEMYDGWQLEAYAYYGRLLDLLHSKR